MRPFHSMHGGPGGLGFLHAGPGIFSLGLSALFLLLLLTLLGLLLWAVGRAIFGRRRVQPAVATAGTTSAVELLSQRYARGEIDDATFERMLAQLRASGAATGYGAPDEGGQWQNV